METMAVSKFKATCLAALDRVRRTGRPIRVTRFGKPLADVVPAAPDKPKGVAFDAMKGRGRIVGDLIHPMVPRSKWNALR